MINKVKVNTKQFASMLKFHSDMACGEAFACHLDFTDNTLWVESKGSRFDLEHALDVARGNRMYKIQIDGTRISNFLQTIDDEDIEIGVDESGLTIDCTERKLRAGFAYARLEDVKVAELSNGDPVLFFDRDVFKNAVKNISPCASKMTSHTIFNNFCLEYDGKDAFIVATDGCIVGKQKLKLAISSQAKPFRFLVPAKRLRRMIDKAPEDDLHIAMSIGTWRFGEYNAGDRITFSAKDFLCGINCGDDKFPNYASFIPNQFKHSFFCDGADIKKAVSSAAKAFKSENETLKIESVGGDISVSRNVDGSSYATDLSGNGDDLTLYASHKILSKIFSKYRKGDRVKVSVNGAKEAMKVSKEGDDLFYVFMGVVPPDK